MTAIVLAAVSALVWGGSDYCGGRATKRGAALTVTVISQVCGLPVLLLSLLLLPGTLHATDLVWGAAAGAGGLLGMVLLYQALATGAMAVAAPITAVTCAVVPMGVGLLMDGPPSAVAFGGTVCAVVAIGLVSVGSGGGAGAATVRVVGTSLAAGAMFGVFFILLARTHEDSGMWPLVGVRFASIGIGLALVARRRVSLRLPRAVLGWVAFAGMGDIAANALYLLAAREGLLSIVAPIAALYPVSTVLLALTLDKEKIRPAQLAGLGLAATALVLTAV